MDERWDGVAPSRHAAIVDPCDIWSAGITAILTQAGLTVECPLPSALAERGFYDARDTLLFISRSMLPCDLELPLPSLGRRSTIIAVLHARDVLSFDDFLRSSLSAVLLTSASREAVLDCVRSVRNGQRWVDPHFAPRSAAWPARSHSPSPLSQREVEVANLAAQGLSNKRIAKELNLSDGTVKVHIHHILGKLGVGRRAELSRLDPMTVVKESAH